MNKIFILSGVPGSGKTTWLENHVGKDNVILHRDEVRKYLRKIYHKDTYFPCSAKNEYLVWIELITTAIKLFGKKKDIYIDQTTLTNNAALKLIKAIDKKCPLEDYDIIFLVFKTDLNICIERNSNRKGYEFVPVEKIKKMYKNFNLNESLIDKAPISFKRNIKIKYLKN